MDIIQDNKSALKLAQLRKASTDGSHIRIIERILEKDGDINFAINVISPYKNTRSYFLGFIAPYLKFTDTIDVFKILLNHGADFTKKDEDGETALHAMITRPKILNGPSEDPFLNAVLSAHVKSNNFSNPCNENGLSHFHIACMTTHSEAVRFFLNSGVSVDEAVGMASRFYPGFTPLHFAAISTNTEVAEMLIEHGANMHIADGRGVTPLHALIEHRMHMLDPIGDGTSTKEGDSYKKLQKQIIDNEKIINKLMENMSTDNDCLDNIGLSTFHVACVLQDLSAAQHLVDRMTDMDLCVNMDSRLWPGYTALHFAAHVSTDTVEMLIKKGANLAAKDVKGSTPLDICIARYKAEDIYRIISLIPVYESLLFSDDVTKVISFIYSLTDLKLFETFITRSMKNINVIIPVDSPLWPGYTPLHLAVLFAKTSKLVDRHEDDVGLQIIKFCFSKNADLSIQDSRGRTALNLAFRLNKLAAVDEILRHWQQIPNVLDEDNLSHFHIVCAVSKTKQVLQNKCALNRSEANVAYRGTSIVNVVKPGSTPLHVCLANPNDSQDLGDIMKILLRNGGDPHIQDAYGLTPVHWLLNDYSWHKRNILLKEITRTCVTEKYGISYLHVACELGNVDTVRRLLEDGAEVNLTIKYTKQSDEDPLSFLSKYDENTPLHACLFDELNKLDLLMEYGADVSAKTADGSSPLEDSSFLYHFVPKLWCNVDMERLVETVFGWTRLHLACFLLMVDGFQDIVEAAKVNAQVFSSSPVWKGWTPLHLLMSHKQDRQVKDRAERMLRILLESGADVTMIDDEQNTPIGVLFEYSVNRDEKEFAALMIKYHRDFSVNPVSAYGVSHFHVACYSNDVEAVRGFISHGVDVNQPIDYFSYWCPGYTPLHLASQLQVVDLLLSHGADVHVENVTGHTALFEAFKRDVFDEDVVAKIIENGADINTPNFRGETPFELALSKTPITMEKLNFCIGRGFQVNSCNPITGVGYLPIILSGYNGNKDMQMHVLDTIMNVNSTGLGRTTLHHFVSRKLPMPENDYYSILDRIIKAGCGVDEQDDEGKTALHVAIDSAETKAVSRLLRFGADVNVADKNGNSPLSYACIRSKSTNDESDSVENILIIHACRLSLLKLYLSTENADIVSRTRESIRECAGNADFENQMNLLKDIRLGVGSICLYDFLSGNRTFTVYRSLNHAERCQVGRYFNAIDNDNRFRVIKGFLRLQHRKLAERTKLLPLAKSSFSSLLGFHFPDLCAENILRYLCNYDLKSIVSAETENDDMEVDVN